MVQLQYCFNFPYGAFMNRRTYWDAILYFSFPLIKDERPAHSLAVHVCELGSQVRSSFLAPRKDPGWCLRGR
jgi:hypothetical protein